jgi:hypothetical protein
MLIPSTSAGRRRPPLASHAWRDHAATAGFLFPACPCGGTVQTCQIGTGDAEQGNCPDNGNRGANRSERHPRIPAWGRRGIGRSGKEFRSVEE